MDRFTLGARKETGGRWVGVVRRGRTVVAECGHFHHGRIVEQRSDTVSAEACMRNLLKAVRQERTATAQRERAHREGLGNLMTRPEDRPARAEAAVAAYNAKLEALRGLLADGYVVGARGVLVITPPLPTQECPACGKTISPTGYDPERPDGERWRVWAAAISPDAPIADAYCADGSYNHPGKEN